MVYFILGFYKDRLIGRSYPMPFTLTMILAFPYNQVPQLILQLTYNNRFTSIWIHIYLLHSFLPLVVRVFSFGHKYTVSKNGEHDHHIE